MRHAPPIARLALAFGAGAAWSMLGAPYWLLPLIALSIVGVPIAASSGPRTGIVWAGACVAGWAAGLVGGAPSRCPAPATGSPVVVEGRFLASPRAGAAPFERADGCGTVTVVLDAADAPAGRTVRLEGRWRQGTRSFWLMGRGWTPGDGSRDGALRWLLVRWRDQLVDRIEALYGAQAPLVAALTLARREGFDPELRQTFARTGLAHLLAISGFHVGVIAGLVYAALGLTGMSPRRARAWAAAGAWGYVALIGFPDAACRAALILAFVAASRSGGRPPARWGALGSAFLVLMVLDPRRIASAGFQLSFAGAGGLVAWAGPVGTWLRRRGRGTLPDPLVTAVASGVAATLATLPIVAWHFEQVSLVGVPATLVASPLVTVALPGAIASVALDFVSQPAARFMAGGVGTLLAGLELGARALDAQPWAAAWTTRATVVAGSAGVVVAAWLSRRPRVGGTARRALAVLYVTTGVVVWPLLPTLQGLGTVEVLAIDVGQGDAIAVRGPHARWVLVDTGPPGRSTDPRAHPVVRALRNRGVHALDALILTHADLDHIGGAVAVLSAMRVGAVFDPGLPAGKEGFVEALAVAEARGVPWYAADAGQRIELGGLSLDILSPSDSLRALDPETNEASVVLLARFGSFEALLTGDAYRPLERWLAPRLPEGIEVLKVGHHGSDTSTDPELLDRIRPRAALISLGRNNRYGHPAPRVLQDLESRGVDVRRTDEEGSIRVVGKRNGDFMIRSSPR